MRKRNPKGYWNFERCQQEALKYETRKEFRTKCRRGYLSSLKNKWTDIICSHINYPRAEDPWVCQKLMSPTFG